MATVNPMPPNVAQAFEQFMPGDGRVFNLWIKEYIIDILEGLGVDVDTIDSNVSTLDSNVSTLDSNVSTLGSTIDGKASIDHNHNLNDLSEKSYNSLDDKPSIPDIDEAELVSDGPTAAAVSSISCPSGADTIDRTTFNTSLSSLITEINNLKDDINSLTTVHDDLIDKLQAAGLMSTT
jgi:hypothetical protein